MSGDRFDPAWAFPGCPEPGERACFDALAKRFEWLAALRGCPQDPRWHAEGDVFVHAGMVCAELVALPSWRALPRVERHILFAATLMHDIGKPATTAEEDGRTRSRGHAVLGARMARRILAEDAAFGALGTPFAIRQAVTALVRHHGLPPVVLSKPDPMRAMLRAAITVRCDWLAILAEADARGRVCLDADYALERVGLFAEYARECGCERAPFAFASAESRFKYFRSDAVPPTIVMPDQHRCEVTLMSGLPASGKDFWIARHAGDTPTISLDDLRGELRIAPDADQGPVVHEAKERAKALLRDGRGFTWNATNTSRMLREGLVDLFAAYGAKVRIVYVEAPWRETLARNARRATPVPAKVMERLNDRLDVPDGAEAHEVAFTA